MTAKVETVNGAMVIRKTNVLANPKNKDKGERLLHVLSRKREHKRKWPEPDCALILNMHFTTQCPERGLHYAQLDVEIPTKNGMDYCTMIRGASNEYDALICLIEALEETHWFHIFRERGVRFKVTGRHMEDLYRGYL